MKCPFCAGYHELPIRKEEVEEHLVVTTDKAFHFHVHGPIGQKSLMKQFLLKIAKEAGIDIEDEETKEIEGKIGVNDAEAKTNVGSRIDQDQILKISGADQILKAGGEDQNSSEGHQPSTEEAEQYSSEGCKIPDR